MLNQQKTSPKIFSFGINNLKSSSQSSSQSSQQLHQFQPIQTSNFLVQKNIAVPQQQQEQQQQQQTQ